MSFEIGNTYSGYEFLDIVKRSKTEIAYRVRNTLTNRIELLRVLAHDILLEDQQQVERFMREMKLHASLVHPNIVTFCDALELERQLVLITELVEGSTLADRLAMGPLPWREALAITRQALAGLASAHAQGIVHRNITPEHLILTPAGVLKIAAFELAKAATSPQLTQVGTVVGTLKYIPPEQVKGTGALDPRSDVYSLGAVLYEALVGKAPFDSKSQFELMMAQVTETPKPPSEANPGIPKPLDAAVLKALAKDPGQRYQTAAEFSAALQSVEESIDRPAVAAPSAAMAAASDVAASDVAASDVAAPDAAAPDAAAPDAVPPDVAAPAPPLAPPSSDLEQPPAIAALAPADPAPLFGAASQQGLSASHWTIAFSAVIALGLLLLGALVFAGK